MKCKLRQKTDLSNDERNSHSPLFQWIANNYLFETTKLIVNEKEEEEIKKPNNNNIEVHTVQVKRVKSRKKRPVCSTTISNKIERHDDRKKETYREVSCRKSVRTPRIGHDSSSKRDDKFFLLWTLRIFRLLLNLHVQTIRGERARVNPSPKAQPKYTRTITHINTIAHPRSRS